MLIHNLLIFEIILAPTNLHILLFILRYSSLVSTDVYGQRVCISSCSRGTKVSCVHCIHRTSSLVGRFVRRWSRQSRDGLSNLSWAAQTVWRADAPHSRVLATQTTRQHVRATATHCMYACVVFTAHEFWTQLKFWTHHMPSSGTVLLHSARIPLREFEFVCHLEACV